MHVVQGIQQAAQNGQQLGPAQFIGRRQGLVQLGAVDMRHDVVGGVVLAEMGTHAHDIRVIECGKQLGFLLKALQGLGVEVLHTMQRVQL